MLLNQKIGRNSMVLNKSQKIIVGAISSAVLSIPNITKIFSEDLLDIIMKDPTVFQIFFPANITLLIISVIKLCLLLMSIWWIISLINIIKLQYKVNNKNFTQYIINLIVTAIVTLIVFFFLKLIFFI